MSLFATSRALAFRPRAIASFQSPIAASWRRGIADENKDGAQGPNMQTQEHISEEAAKIAKIQGGSGPDLTQGTPVQEILEGDKEAQKNAPQVLKDSIKAGTTPAKPSQSRTFSTLARRRQELSQTGGSGDVFNDPNFIASTLSTPDTVVPATPVTVAPTGHKFGLPTLPLPSDAHKDYRYDPVIRQFTNLMMQHGKLSVAQRNMSTILTYLRTQSPPNYSASRPLLPGAPPSSHLPLNPVLYLTLAVDSIAPLMRIRSQRGAAGGGVALQIPVPLGLRQRRRTAFEWILDAASKRRSRASGRDMFAIRVAEELVAIVEGRSSAWEKRTGIHKIATTARSNLNFGKTGLRR